MFPSRNFLLTGRAGGVYLFPVGQDMGGRGQRFSYWFSGGESGTGAGWPYYYDRRFGARAAPGYRDTLNEDSRGVGVEGQAARHLPGDGRRQPGGTALL